MKRYFNFLSLLLLFFINEKQTHQFREQPGLMAGDEKLLYPSLVDKFYQLNNGTLCWMKTGDQYALLRRQLLAYMDTTYSDGLIEKKYHETTLHYYAGDPPQDSAVQWKADRLFTDAAIALYKDVYQGYKIESWVRYDQLSSKKEDAGNLYLLQTLVTALSADTPLLDITPLEPVQPGYSLLKRELRKQQQKNHRDTAAILKRSMNYYRWMRHFRFDQWIVINLPDARLHYYENDSLVLNMRAVVGKTSTPTPQFATVCDQVILYPYWYVPPSITFNEYLPKIKNDPSWLDAHNMQVIDGAGNVLDHRTLKWSSFHRGNFPYTLRQSTGCDNALGVIKFNIITPYGVYLHDTNNKTAFLSGLRYYSHGCIRIEEPFELGNKLLEGRLDTAYLQACFKTKKPAFIQLKKKIPVFSVYMQAVAGADGKVRYYKDVYKLAD